MWLIAGLGNPGNEYESSRHNLGFWVIDELSRILNISLKKKNLYVIGKGKWQDIELCLVKPLTYMNLSGVVVEKILKDLQVQPENLIVIHDDIDLSLGKIRIRKKGSDGGHRGIRSIIEKIKTPYFNRVKIGIGRPECKSLVVDYVLNTFEEDELAIIRETTKSASKMVLDLIQSQAK